MVRWKNQYLLQPAYNNWLGQVGQMAGYGPAATQKQGTTGMNAAINTGKYGVLGAQNQGQQAVGTNQLYANALKSVMETVFDSMSNKKAA